MPLSYVWTQVSRNMYMQQRTLWFPNRVLLWLNTWYLTFLKCKKKDHNNTCSFFTKIHINHLIIFKNLKISIDKPDQIIIDGNSRVESPKTQVSDKSATSNCFISIGIKYLVFCRDLNLRTYFCVKL